jgi:hypothetical protein
MTMDKNRASLVQLCKEARALDRAIGEWLFGPTAGTYYVYDLRSECIEAGEAGMSLDELAAWFAGLERRNESTAKIKATPGSKRRPDSASVRPRSAA